MAWLSICGEIRRSSNFVQQEPMSVLYCQRSVTKDYRLAREITRILTKEIELNARKKICSLRSLMVSFRIEDVGEVAFVE
ncbi:hypothetical protein Tco_1385318 [Tanacetum coccineum]